MDGRFTRQKNEISVWMVVKGRKCGGALRASPFHPDSSTRSCAQMKCVDEGFVKRPWKLQILFLRHQPMHVRLQKSLERRPKPVAFESKIREKRGMKLTGFQFFLFFLFLCFLILIKQ